MESAQGALASGEARVGKSLESMVSEGTLASAEARVSKSLDCSGSTTVAAREGTLASAEARVWWRLAF